MKYKTTAFDSAPIQLPVWSGIYAFNTKHKWKDDAIPDIHFVVDLANYKDVHPALERKIVPIKVSVISNNLKLWHYNDIDIGLNFAKGTFIDHDTKLDLYYLKCVIKTISVEITKNICEIELSTSPIYSNIPDEFLINPRLVIPNTIEVV